MQGLKETGGGASRDRNHERGEGMARMAVPRTLMAWEGGNAGGMDVLQAATDKQARPCSYHCMQAARRVAKELRCI